MKEKKKRQTLASLGKKSLKDSTQIKYHPYAHTESARTPNTRRAIKQGRTANVLKLRAADTK